MDKVATDLLEIAYSSETKDAFNQQMKAFLGKNGVTKLEMPKRLEKELKTNANAYPKTSQEALRFLTYLPLPTFRKSPIFEGFLMVLSPEDKKKIPAPTTVWGEQKLLRARFSPHAEECDLIALDLYDESKCTCGKPPPIVEGAAVENFPKVSWVQNLLDHLGYNLGVSEAFIMGSVAKKTATPESDLDITAIVDNFEEDMDYEELNNDIANSLAGEVKWGDRVVDLQVWSSDDPRLKTYSKIPLKASVEAGARGDWKKEGYKIKEKNSMSAWDSGSDWIIEAFDPKGKKCAELRVYNLGPNTITSSDTRVDEEHRRKGLASAMYEYAEKKSGKRMIPAEEASEDPDNFSDDAKEFWNQPNRSFGSTVTAGMLDFPRKKLPEDVWLYEPENPLPRLQPKLRANILAEARYRLSKFGAKLIGAMLYGGAATYQYHKGGDIDVSLYIDWKNFKGSEDILQDAFKKVEIPWGDYELHLFVKPSDQQEQIEVADAVYDVMRDEWVLPPLVLPKDFDPDVFFKPMIEMAEKKAQRIDILMGEVGREWMRLKKAFRALKEGARDEWVVREKIEVVKSVLLDKLTDLCDEFVRIWKARKKLHDELRKRYINDRNIGRFERFQLPEVTWKYLDEMGYVEYLKILAKAHEAGVIKNLLDTATPEDDSDDEEK